MSFIRPELRRGLLTWAETAIYLGLTFGALWWLLAQSGLTGPWRWGLAAFVCAVGLTLARSAALAALSKRGERAPGVVSIDERRIAYFGPEAGGIVSLEELSAIDIMAEDPSIRRHEAEWALRAGAGEAALIIPVSAAGADGLIDAFAALPGFAPTRALAALAAAPGSSHAIWRRDGARAPALAVAGGGD